MIELLEIEHSYGDTKVLQKVSLKLESGQIGCVLGPSGCGKSTLLRCIAGFEVISGGQIRTDRETLNAANRHLPAELRRIGMVFQDYALLPHLTVLNNVAFGLHQQNSEQRRRRSMDMLERVRLAELAQRYPHELSGGQQQRVAIARALAPQPELLLMDEPFSNLDGGMRARLGQEVKDLLNGLGATALIVTHDHHDAFAMSDVAGVLHDGKLKQWSRTYDLYHKPEDRYVADFVGRGVWLPGVVSGNNEVNIEFARVRGDLPADLAAGTRVDFLLRPDDVVHDDASELTAEVVSRRFRGSEFLYELALASGQRLLSSVPSHHDHAIGEQIGFRLETDHLVVFPAEGI